MANSNESIQVLAQYLQQTLSPDVTARKTAEKYLESVEGTKNYSLLLLSVIDQEGIDPTIRIAGAITFKNFVKRNWKIQEDADIINKIHEEDRITVKQLIVNLMLKSPESIQRQLSDAIQVIGKEDFPAKWPNLLKEMVSRFGSGDFHVINGVLRTAHSIFKRYRHEFKSNELWMEIKFVLSEFAPHLTQLFQALINLANQHENSKDAIKIIYNSLTLVAKIFNSLNFQDLPEYFEDNMSIWMDNFHLLLLKDNPLLKTAEHEDAGLLEQLKSQICDNVGMYAQKYDEEFSPFLPTFVTDIWNLLVTTGNEPKYDLLVSNAIQFLAMVADKDKYKTLFEDPNTLSSICEKVIIPNMEFRGSDQELFEDNPEEYIRRDIEGSDVDTRRRAACDLVKALTRHFEKQITAIFGQYVEAMLAKYKQNPQFHWRNKDAAIYLVTSLTAKGQTQKHGITQTNQLVNLFDFYQNNILPDLTGSNVNDLPVLKADAMKFLMVFRNQLSHQAIKDSIPHLIRHMMAESPVCHTYAVCTFEKILLIKNSDNSALINDTHLALCIHDLLSNLFSILGKEASKENEYVMKAIMRSFSTLQGGIIPFMGQILPKLTEILINVSKNPSKPHFNHYLFESLSLSVKISCKANVQYVSEFEKAFFPIFQQILFADVTEFIPYVFQILSLLLEFHSTGIPEPYIALFPCLLAPPLWERPGNIHPLVRLIQSFIARGPEQIPIDKLNAILGVFQKLIASKMNDHEGFYLVSSLIEHIPDKLMAEYIKQIFLVLFQRLTSSKTTKYIKSLLVFFGLYTVKYGAASFVQIVDSIQAKMFAMVLDRLFISELQKVSGTNEKKLCAVGITKILCDIPEYTLLGDYVPYWPPLLQALIGLFELPEDETIPENEHFIEIEDTPGYQTAYSQLVFAGKAEIDPLKGAVPDPKVFLAQSLGKLSIGHPGKVQPLIASAVAPEAQNFLNKYLVTANVQLN